MIVIGQDKSELFECIEDILCEIGAFSLCGGCPYGDNDKIAAADGIVPLHLRKPRTDDSLCAVSLNGTSNLFGCRDSDPV